MKWGNDEPRKLGLLARLKSKMIDALIVPHKRTDVQLPVYDNCHSCIYDHAGKCASPVLPDINAFYFGFARVVTCWDKVDLAWYVTEQAKQITQEAWNAPRS